MFQPLISKNRMHRLPALGPSQTLKMKFIYHASLAALFGSFAVAVPANSLTLSLNLENGDDAKYQGSGLPSTTTDICWRACFPEQPECPEPLVGTRRAGWLYRSESELTNVVHSSTPNNWAYVDLLLSICYHHKLTFCVRNAGHAVDLGGMS